LSFLGVSQPILPVYVNAYVPPQPSIERCYGFGQALARGLRALDVRAVVVASGGMSHFPGTEQYSQPHVEWDRALFETLKTGNLRALLAYGADELDRRGNVELRSWAIAAGLLGERKPDVSAFEPSWHHTYALLAWHERPADRTDPLHYPPIHARRVRFTALLHRLANDAAVRAHYVADPQGFAASSDLAPDEKHALAALDQGQVLALGIHPLVFFLAQFQIEHERTRP
jgi:2,3-dihydroxyphenylpropionate 1,2-dioxygenase